MMGTKPVEDGYPGSPEPLPELPVEFRLKTWEAIVAASPP